MFYVFVYFAFISSLNGHYYINSITPNRLLCGRNLQEEHELTLIFRSSLSLAVNNKYGIFCHC